MDFYYIPVYQSLTWQRKAKSNAMIEDIDICSCFQDPVDEPPFGQENPKRSDHGDGQGNAVDRQTTLHSYIFFE